MTLNLQQLDVFQLRTVQFRLTDDSLCTNTHTVRMDTNHSEATVGKVARLNTLVETAPCILSSPGVARHMWRYWFRDKPLDIYVVHQFLNSTTWTGSHCRHHPILFVAPQTQSWKRHHKRKRVTSHLWRYWWRTPAADSVCNALVTETITNGVLSCDTICGAT